MRYCMIPEQIQPFFESTAQKTCGENTLIEGVLTCCNAHEFEVFIKGTEKRSLRSRLYLSSHDDDIVVEARCKKCGRLIPLFDSKCDGYEQRFIIRNRRTIEKRLLNCKNCEADGFSVRLKYEYPDFQELVDLNIADIENAFTWIWISLECNNCRTIYKNFVDFEA